MDDKMIAALDRVDRVLQYAGYNHTLNTIRTGIAELTNERDEAQARSGCHLFRAEAAEARVAELAKDAARGRHAIKYAGWQRDDDGRTCMTIPVVDGADLSCVATRENALDAAIDALAGQPMGDGL
jgi:hypothetical protein